VPIAEGMKHKSQIQVLTSIQYWNAKRS